MVTYQHIVHVVHDGLIHIISIFKIVYPFLHSTKKFAITLHIFNDTHLLLFEGFTQQRNVVLAALERMRAECPEIPCIIDGQPVKTGIMGKQVMPTRHAHTVCTYHQVCFARSSKQAQSNNICGSLF